MFPLFVFVVFTPFGLCELGPAVCSPKRLTDSQTGMREEEKEKRKKTTIPSFTLGVLVKITASLQRVGSRRCRIWWIKDLLFTAKWLNAWMQLEKEHLFGDAALLGWQAGGRASFGAILVFSKLTQRGRAGGGVRRKRARSFKEDAEEEDDDNDDDDDAAIAGHLSGSTRLLNLVTDERAMATPTVMTGWDASPKRRTALKSRKTHVFWCLTAVSEAWVGVCARLR